MEQGDCNAPATMMRVMNWILKDHLGKNVMVYIDDILIGTHTLEEHKAVTRAVCRLLKKNGLWFNKKKCQTLPARMDLLGHILTKHGLEADPTKIKQVNQFPKPVNRKQLQKFIGVVNYLRKFAPNLAAVAAPLSELQGSTQEYA